MALLSRHRLGTATTGAGAGASETTEVATDSGVVAGWTLVSRITGFGRVATMAAVLGPTYFGNLFQTANLLPNILHELLTGSLITALLVPPLVRCVDGGDARATERLASAFLGTALLAFSIVLALSLLAAPWLVRLMTLGVDDPAVWQRQQELGWLLVALLMPQVLFYGIAATGVAVQHAHRRFALAAAAPALENLGVIAVMLVSASWFGLGVRVEEVTVPQLLLLGLGTTAAVGVHAAAQWWGAYRVGVRLVPRVGWRDPEVRRIVRLAIPSSGYAALNGASYFGLLVVAGGIPGGAVALQIGLNFFNLPIALCARPVAATLLPRLSRSFNRDDGASFHATYRASLALSLFVALPAAFLFVGIPEILARLVSFGDMASGTGIAMVAATVAGLGPGIVGEAAFLVSTSASYARRDAMRPMRAMAVRVALAFVGMAIAFSVMDGVAVLWTLALAHSAANLIAAAYLHWSVVRLLPPSGERAGRQFVGNLTVAAIAVVPGVLLAEWLEHLLTAGYREVCAGVVAVAVSAFAYLALQYLRGSGELEVLLSAVQGAKLSTLQRNGRERAKPRPQGSGARPEPPP